MPKIDSEKIDCSYRPCSRPAPRGKIESVRTHSEVIEQFDSFSLLKLLFLVRKWHCWSWKAFPRQMTPQSREKTAKTAVFRHRWQAWKVVRSIAAECQRPRTPRNRRCSFAFFETFLWHFNKKQRAEVIFGLSRPVSFKNQENGSGKRWSLHAPLNWNEYCIAGNFRQRKIHQKRQSVTISSSGIIFIKRWSSLVPSSVAWSWLLCWSLMFFHVHEYFWSHTCGFVKNLVRNLI